MPIKDYIRRRLFHKIRDTIFYKNDYFYKLVLFVKFLCVDCSSGDPLTTTQKSFLNFNNYKYSTILIRSDHNVTLNIINYDIDT